MARSQTNNTRICTRIRHQVSHSQVGTDCKIGRFVRMSRGFTDCSDWLWSYQTNIACEHLWSRAWVVGVRGNHTCESGLGEAQDEGLAHLQLRVLPLRVGHALLPWQPRWSSTQAPRGTSPLTAERRIYRGEIGVWQLAPPTPCKHQVTLQAVMLTVLSLLMLRKATDCNRPTVICVPMCAG